MASKALTLATIFRAVDKFTGPTKRMTGSAGKLVSTVAKFGAAAVAAGAAAGIAVTRAASKFAEQGDEIAKTSRMLGLSTDALQELRYAAGLQGVTSEQLTQGLKLLNNQLGQMQAGEGTLYSALAKTDPELAKRLRTVRDTDEAFSMLMEAIASETNVQKRAMIAQAAFGKSGQELIKFANGGADAMEALRAEAHKYGAVISQEAAENSEAFNDSMGRLKKSLQGLAYQGLGLVVQKMQPMIQGAADWIAANREIIGARLSRTFEIISSAAESMGKVFSTLAPLLEPLLGVLDAILPLVAKVADVVSAVLGPVIKVIGGVVQGLTDLLSGNWATAQVPGRESTKYGDASNGSRLAPVTSTTTERSMVDIAVRAEHGAAFTAKQTGAAPGVTLNLGTTMGGGSR